MLQTENLKVGIKCDVYGCRMCNVYKEEKSSSFLSGNHYKRGTVTTNYLILYQLMLQETPINRITIDKQTIIIHVHHFCS